MIHLDFTPPDGDAAWDAWIRDGRAAVEQMMLADVTGNRPINDALYKRERDRFLAVTHKKCAYCELLLAAGQRKGDVEHYRPKGRVTRMDGEVVKVVKVLRDGVEIDHPGYFWLAYDYLNLLPACSACNRRAGDAASGVNTGKSDIFPTLDNHWAACPEDVPTEQPALLNPWLDDPTQHLFFDPDTGVAAGITQRGRITVRLLGLNRDGLPEGRKKACENLRLRLQKGISDAVDDGPRSAEVITLQSVADGSAEYAAVCRVECLRANQKVMDFLASVGGQPPTPPQPDILYVCIDGTGEPVIAADTEGRPGEGDEGTAHAGEVKTAVVFTQTITDEAGLPVRDPASSTYVADFALAAEFGTRMVAEARRRGATNARHLVILGDGTAWIWNLAAQHFPDATQIVDLYHARQHLHELAKLLEFMLGDHKEEWLAQRLAELDDGVASAICAAARAFPLAGKEADDLETALGYFEYNAHRMQYAHFKSLGMFIGSGIKVAVSR
jgi:hypothetical protein